MITWSRTAIVFMIGGSLPALLAATSRLGFSPRRSLLRQSGGMFLALTCTGLTLGRAPAVAGHTRSDQRQGCAPGDLAAIKRAFVKGMKEKDLNVLKLYAPDAVFTNPDGSKLSGKPLRQLFVSVFDQFDSDLHLHAIHVFPTKNGACVEEGSFREHLRTRANGRLVNSTGKYRFTYVLGRFGWSFQAMKWIQTSRAEMTTGMSLVRRGRAAFTPPP